MASAAPNATSTWPTRLRICRAGPCIPRKSGSRVKNPGKWYYQCPRDPPCQEWNGWCNESIPNVAHSQDDRSCHFTKSSEAYNFNGHNLSQRMLAIENAVRTLMVIGIVTCVLLLVILVCMPL